MFCKKIAQTYLFNGRIKDKLVDVSRFDTWLLLQSLEHVVFDESDVVG